MQIRALTETDEVASTRASRDAFGGRIEDQAPYSVGAGVRRWGMFDGSILAAKANDREYTSMIGGRPVPTAGVAGVLVAPEYRGTGLARLVMTHLLAEARQRGASISTLFRTVPALYRSLGYEQVADLLIGELPAAALRGLRSQPSTTVRRALVSDVPAIRQAYARIAAAGSCLLTRIGPCFTRTDQELLDSYDGITIATDDDDQLTGYFGWHRGSGIGGAGVLTVNEFFSLTADATQSLLAVAGSFAAVTATIRFRTSGADPMHWLIPGAGWSVTDVRPYMLRVVDLAGVVKRRGWPTGLSAAVDFTVDDPVCPWNSGQHRLEWSGGEACLRPGSACGLVICARGLAVLLAGDATAAGLRRAGLLTGGTPADDTILDAAMAGPRPAIMDEF